MSEQSIEVFTQKIRGELIRSGHATREINEKIPIRGERLRLPLAGREIGIVYYRAKDAGRPLLIALHGGGFVDGGSALDDQLWSTLRDTLQVNVASVAYRQTPEFRWPAPVYDAYDSAVYLQEHAADFAFDGSSIFIMGNSAGGNIAATTCIYAKQQGRDLFKQQILIYPLLDLAADPLERGGEGIFSGPVIAVMNGMYADVCEYKNSMLSPVYATSEELKGLPPAIMCMAGQDGLCIDGERYAEMLKQASVPVAAKTFPDMPHAYLENGFAAHVPDVMLEGITKKTLEDGSMKTACEETVAWIQDHFAG